MGSVNHGERLGQQPHPPRPSLQSHHSSSVPSTPYQQPRDLRFHSRSPSPNRGLANQSPRSFVSEVVGGNGATQRPAPSMCKFETGAEFRKRRIAYEHGGNEELAPPKKEPKKSLDPDEHEKLSGDMRELYDRLLPSEESEKRRAQLVEKLDRILNEEWPGNDIRVNVFGSSGNLLSSSDSDVDICITTPLKKLESMHSIALLLHKNGMQKVVCRASAKVPIVKCWDPELRLAADLNVNNPLALENTRMIKTYVQLDPRVRPLAKIVKYWTKRRILNDAAFGGTISSYTWICMIINFLQRRDPPILPSLQKTADKRKTCENGEKSHFADDLEALKGFGDANKETLAELLFQFFRHYGYEFEFSKYVVSVKEGKLLTRKDKGWEPTNYQNKEARCRLCVEEPFTTDRNLGNSADDYAWSGIHTEIRRAFELLADCQQLEKCCEQYEFPVEEKPIFQRPPPKPKPTLTRSASQSGRPNQEQGSNRSRKGGGRNQSAKPGSRRASSGATFSNQRVPLGFQSPPLSSNMLVDYFAAKGDLHNHLFQQYQLLQAQQDTLRAQLAQQQVAAQGRVGDLAGSPYNYRQLANGMASPRLMEGAPPSAPLLPSYLHQFSPRYPQSSPLSQTRTRDGGTNTNPSSPSLSTAVPTALPRRQIHRGSIPEGSSRSQSQPGRSFAHPLASQQQFPPGFDVQRALSGQYPTSSSSQVYPTTQAPMPIPFPPLASGFPTAPQPMDSARPKDYVGYYVGQSPSLGPQYATSSQMQMPTMTLQNPPTRQRRVTPDLAPPLLNGRHSSRSPSPLGHQRNFTVAGEVPAAQPLVLQSPGGYETPEIPAAITAPPVDLPPRPRARNDVDFGGPLIVNGSNPIPDTKPKGQTDDVQRPPPPSYSSEPSGVVNGTGLSRVQSLPLRPNIDTALGINWSEPAEKPMSPRKPPTPKMKTGPKLDLSPNGTPQNADVPPEQFAHETTPVAIAAPLLSPVAELRTPSPTQSNAFEKDSPRANGFAKAAQLNSAKLAENISPTSSPKHERKSSAPNPTMPKPAKSPTQPTPTSATNPNPWQQVPKKGHKKSKSTATATPLQGSSGGRQPLPLNETERKGG